MSNRVLTEPSSQRMDGKVWVWTYADPVRTPFHIRLFAEDEEGVYVYADIPKDFIARVFIKDDLRDSDAILTKVFKFVEPSVFVMEFDTDEVIQLRAGKTYHLGVALYNEQGDFIRTLIADLPLRIDKSVLSNSVFG